MAELSRGLAGAARAAVRDAAKAVRERIPTPAPPPPESGEDGVAVSTQAPAPRPARKKTGTTRTPSARNRASADSPASPEGAAPQKGAGSTRSRAAAKTARPRNASVTAARTSAAAPAKRGTAAKRAPAATSRRGSGADSRAAGKGVPMQQVIPEQLRVREDEVPWTAEELAGVRAELEEELQRLGREVRDADLQIAELIRDSGDGAGDDQADSGSKAFEREHEMTLANNARELLAQNRHALDRIGNGTYGVCESCGNPIGKRRLQVFPRATLCVTCKQRQERH